MPLSPNELNSIVNLDAKNRYKYSIKRIVDAEFAWGLYNDGWALAGDENGNLIFPLWPAEGFAVLCINDDWKNYTPTSIDLEDLINELIPNLSKDKVKISMCYLPDDKGMVLEPEKVLFDLNEELEKYN